MSIKIVNPDRANDANLDEEIQELESAELPEKYKGKTAEQIATMHMEAEKALSRQGQTVGEQRKVIDQFIQLQLQEKSTTNTTPTVREPVTTDALFADPDKAINTAVTNSEVGTKVTDVDKRLNALNLRIEQKDFETRHDGKVRDILSDPNFHTWLQAAPHRVRLAQQLDQYDFAAGDDLIGLWKDHQEISDVKNKKEEVQRRRQDSLNAAKTEGGGAGGGETSPKTIYRRSEISDLMTRARTGDKEARAKTDSPEWQARIRQAYAEGRVR